MSLDAMSGGRVQKTYVVSSPQGLHMRPLTAFAQKAATYECDVTVTRDDRSVNGKNAWEMMTMVSLPGAVLTIQAEGTDAAAAADGLLALLEYWNEIDAADSAAPAP
jgi:phosphotransferase system HPr (HPr) family protein